MGRDGQDSRVQYPNCSDLIDLSDNISMLDILGFFMSVEIVCFEMPYSYCSYFKKGMVYLVLTSLSLVGVPTSPQAICS